MAEQKTGLSSTGEGPSSEERARATERELGNLRRRFAPAIEAREDCENDVVLDCGDER